MAKRSTLTDVRRIAERFGLKLTDSYEQGYQRSCHCGSHQIARFGHLPGCPIRPPHIATRDKP